MCKFQIPNKFQLLKFQKFRRRFSIQVPLKSCRILKELTRSDVRDVADETEVTGKLASRYKFL